MRAFFAFVVSLYLFALVTGCGPSLEERVRKQKEKSAINVNLPKGMTHAEDAPEIKNDAGKVVSVSRRSYYVGSSEYPLDLLGDLVRKNIAAAPNAPVYFQADYTEDYGEVAKVFDTIRKASVSNLALLVSSDGNGPPRRLMAVIAPEPRPDMAPDPNAVVVLFAKDGTLSINGKEAGTPDEPGKFVDAVKAASGKSVTIKARRDTRYIDVVRLVDAAKGAGAASIILAIDDLN